jgi:hypothetical protein
MNCVAISFLAMSSPESDNSDSDAPETVSLKIAKREFTTQRKVDEERQRASVLSFQSVPFTEFHHREAQIKHQKNQARDAKLKAEKKRKDAVKKPIKESLPMEEVLLENQDSESMRLQDRMEKAMRDAEEDQDLTESEDDVMQDPNEEDATSSADDSEPNPDYLPDHIFTKQPPKRPEHPPEDKRRRRNRKATHRKKVEERMIG